MNKCEVGNPEHKHGIPKSQKMKLKKSPNQNSGTKLKNSKDLKVELIKKPMSLRCNIF